MFTWYIYTILKQYNIQNSKCKTLNELKLQISNTY